MIRFNQAKVRPRSTRTITDFRGLWHNLGDAATLDNSRSIRWYDELNLSSDGAPALTVRRGRSERSSVDGTQVNFPVIAACEGDPVVLMDEYGNMWCNGHHLNNVLGSTTWYTECEYTMEVLTDRQPLAWGTNAAEPNNTGYIVTQLLGTDVRQVVIVRRFDEDLFPAEDHYVGWAYQNALQEWTALTLSDWKIGYQFTDIRDDPQVGDKIYVNISPTPNNWYGRQRSMVRMGGYVIISPDMMMVNVAKLAAGLTVTADCLRTGLKTTAGETMTITPCLLDGTALTIEKSSTPPSDVTKTWVDTSTTTTVYRQYSSALESWQAMQTVYLKIVVPMYMMDVGITGTIKTGDTVKLHYDISYSDIQDVILAEEAKRLLNSYQYLYYGERDSITGIVTMIIAGVLRLDQAQSWTTRLNAFTVVKDVPDMDFMVEAGNRLWGCRSGLSNDGELVNEIYASALGDPTNWHVHQGLSTDSWTASRGLTGKFTGAAVLSGSPLFFREDSLEKVYPSSTGAHQVQTFDLEGVMEGCSNTLVVIEERLYYQSRRGIVVYSGSIPQSISEAFGDMKYGVGTAGRHKRKYCISFPMNGEQVVAVYDIDKGDWHLESEGWTGKAFTVDDYLCYIKDKKLYCMDWANNADGVSWHADTGIIGYELPEHRFISCVRIRFQILDSNEGEIEAYIQYDDELNYMNRPAWQRKCDIFYDDQNRIGTKEINIFPRRCDHFRLKLLGTGGIRIVSLSYRIERSEGGH